jgi:GrpB-like predicted nucleotidyltransferase (UPF0157 family)
MKERNTMSKSESVVDPPIVDESSWRQELEYLDRLLTGRLNEVEAKTYADTELTKHNRLVQALEKELLQVEHVLSTAEQSAFLPRAEKKDMLSRVESLKYDLAEARKRREQSILKCGAGIKAAKDCDKLRSRWRELREREKLLRRARDISRNKRPTGFEF